MIQIFSVNVRRISFSKFFYVFTDYQWDSLLPMDFILYERKTSVSVFCWYICLKLEITDNIFCLVKHFSDPFGMKDKEVRKTNILCLIA